MAGSGSGLGTADVSAASPSPAPRVRAAGRWLDTAGSPEAGVPPPVVLALVVVVVVVVGLAVGVTAKVMHHTADSFPSGSVGLGGNGPQPIRAPSANVVRPEQFGAVGDGVHDDGPAVQKAIDAAAGHGVAVLSTDRTYLCGQALRLPSHATLLGLGPGAALRFTWTDQSRSTNGGPYLSNADTKHGNSDITLQNFTILGGGSGEPSGPSADYPNGLGSSVRLYLVDHIVMTNLLIRNAPGDAFNLWAVTDAAVVDNDIQRSGRGGVIVHYTNDGNNERVLIQHNLIADLGDDGIAVAGTGKRTENTTGTLPTGIQILDNTVSSWQEDPNGKIQGRGIALLGVTDAVVMGNVLSDLPESGILLRGADLPGQLNPLTGQPYVSSQVTISHNTITNVGQNAEQTSARFRTLFVSDGIEIDSGQAVTATDNIIRSVTGNPVTVTSCSSCTTAPNQT